MTDREHLENTSRARTIAEAAIALPDEQRESFIERSCQDDATLQNQVHQILAATQTGDTFLQDTIVPPRQESLSGKKLDEIGRYKIRRVIGEGGMGIVYEAVQLSPRRTVALKMIKKGVASRSAMRRFAYEAQTLGRLHHEGIAQIYEADTYNDGSGEVPWFAMEYIAGAMPLTAYADEKKLGTRQRLALFTKVCEAISHGHQKGIIHRDLKPGNILVDVNGQPKIIDYGIARATDSDMAVTTLQTDVGQLLGTVQYMSPEQCAADPDILDTRSDVYSLGVILYELLCDGYPYDLSNVPVFEAARMIREHDPVRPSTINRTLRGDIETIVLKALQKDRDQRYQSAHELQRDIERYLNDDPISARPPSLSYQFKVFAKRNRALFVSASVIAVVLLAATIISTMMAINAQQSAKTAREAESNLLLNQDRLEASQAFLIHVLSIPTPSIAQGRDLDHTDLLKIAGQDIDDWFQGMPDYQVDHHSLIGHFMVMMGMHDEAEQHLIPALAKLETQHGRDHYKTQFALINVARMRNGQGHPREADQLSAEVEAWVRAKDHWNPMDIQFLIHRLEILDSLTKWEDVVTLAEEAIAALQPMSFDRPGSVYTKDETELRLKSLLGRNLTLSSQLIVDEELRRSAIVRGHALMNEVIEEASAIPRLGPRHPITLESTADLMICRWGMNLARYEDVTKAVDELQLVHGEENLGVLQHQILIANLLVMKDQHKMSEDITRHCMELLRGQLDPDHPMIHSANFVLGWSLAHQGKHEEAVSLLGDSIDILTERLGKDNIALIRTRGSYGRSLMAIGQLEKGEPYVNELITVLESLAGRMHHEPLYMRFEIILSHFEHGDKDDAFRMMKSLLKECRENLPKDSEVQARLHCELGDMYRDIGDYEKATEIYEEAYENAIEHLEPTSKARRSVFSDLQVARHIAGDLEGALIVNDQIIADSRIEWDQFGWGLGGRLKLLEGTDRLVEVDQILDEAINECWDNPSHLNLIAWSISADMDHDEGRVRYADEILRASRRACDLTDFEESNYLDTLAQILSQRGDIDAAISHQRSAVRLAPEDGREKFQKRLERYMKQSSSQNDP